MKKQTIIALTKLATNRSNLAIEITYARTGANYRILGFIKVKFNGEWYVQVQYKSIADGKVYSRDSSDFGGFNEVVL